MSTAILGFGAIGQALARAFARKNIQVSSKNNCFIIIEFLVKFTFSYSTFLIHNF